MGGFKFATDGHITGGTVGTVGPAGSQLGYRFNFGAIKEATGGLEIPAECPSGPASQESSFPPFPPIKL